MKIPVVVLGFFLYIWSMKRGFKQLGQSKSKQIALKDITEDGRNYVCEESKILNSCKIKQTIITIDTTKL